MRPGVALSLLIGTIFTFYDGLISAPVDVTTTVEAYLKRFGYLVETQVPGPGELQDETTKYRRAIEDFQRFAGIPVTGEPDEKTLEVMRLPRCAVPDNNGQGSLRRARKRRRRYVLQGSQWSNSTILRYYFENTTQQMTPELNRAIVQKAFQFWTNVSGLVVAETSDPDTANIRLLYAVQYHGDVWPFDGRGGILGHAFYPDSGGDAHFDDDEFWTDGISSGTNLLQVTTHELGHSLGLGHSNDSNSVMAPFYRGYSPSFSLGEDDIRAIRILYGQHNDDSKTTTTTTTAAVTSLSSRAPSSSSSSSLLRRLLCASGRVDAIVHAGSQTLAFQGNMYAALDGNGILPGYPRLIRQEWPDLPDDIDSALYLNAVVEKDSYGNSVLLDLAHLFFFKGDIYWRYNNTYRLESGYPKRIQDGFPGIPNNLDSTFVWSGNGKTYFVKGEDYYCYNRWRGADSTYPRTLAVWRGLPPQIDAAFQWSDSHTYFFSGTEFYRFNDAEFRVEAGYPKSIASSWFNCPSSQSPGQP